MSRPRTYFLVDGPYFGDGACFDGKEPGTVVVAHRDGFGPQKRKVFTLEVDAFTIQARARDQAIENVKALESADPLTLRLAGRAVVA